MRLMRLYGLDEALRRFRGPVLGTCAGMIVLDREHLGLVDVSVERNAYGRQISSFEADLQLEGDERAAARESSSALRAFARPAPTSRCWPRSTESPVALRQGRFIVAAFHPELTDDTRIHEKFLELVREENLVGS